MQVSDGDGLCDWASGRDIGWQVGGVDGDRVEAEWTVSGFIAAGYVVFGTGDGARIIARPRSSVNEAGRRTPDTPKADDEVTREQTGNLGPEEISAKRIDATVDLVKELRSSAATARAVGSPAAAIVAGLLVGGYIESEGTENVTVRDRPEA